MRDEPTPEQPTPTPDGAHPWLVSRWWHAIALGVLLLGLWPIAAPVLEAGPREVVARQDAPPFLDSPDPEHVHHWDAAGRADLRFVAWQVARNSRAILESPTRIFDGEMCFPARASLAYGPSGITLGLLAVPLRVVSDDPVLLFNLTFWLLYLISGAILYLLVKEWTGLPAAGIVAAAIYVMHEVKVGDVIHLYVRDTAWTLLALLFARRLFEQGRWRDAAGLAFAIGMHLSGSLYPLVAAALIAPFSVAWLIRVYGITRRLAARLAGVALVTALGAALLLGPYLALREAGDLGTSTAQLFVPLYSLLPGRPAFPGFTTLVLVALALAWPAHLATPGIRLAGDGDDAAGAARASPRWALLAALLLLLSTSVVVAPESPSHWVALDRNAPDPRVWPNLYVLLERWIPGLSLGRGPGGVYVAAQMLMALLAGLGGAALIRRAARLRPAAAVVLAGTLVVLATLETARPAALGFRPLHGYEAIRIRPDDATLALYGQLAERMQEGALLEVPASSLRVVQVAESVLLTAYHGRPTSHCYSPFLPEETRRVRRLARRAPDEASLDALAALGFRGLVVHHPPEEQGSQLGRLRYAEYARGAGAERLEHVGGDARRTTYLIRAASPDPADVPARDPLTRP